jgi:hypothetical protein
VPKLLKAFHAAERVGGDDAESVCGTILYAFREIGAGAADASGTLRRILVNDKHRDSWRINAAIALGNIGKSDAATLTALRKAAESDDMHLRAVAKAALRKLDRK